MQEKTKNVIKEIPGARWTYHLIREILFRIQDGTHYKYRHYNPILVNISNKSKSQSDISDHLGTIFYFASDASLKLIVELGTRGGESTHALLAVADTTKSQLLSIDLHDCEKLDVPFHEHWHFVKADDIEFGKTGFKNWCLSQSIEPIIDVLFIDTSHQYEHTKMEIEIWSKFLSTNGVMIFHDTNMGKGIYARMDGSIGFSWDNNRGVMRAIEEYMGRKYDENSFFCDLINDKSILHFPNCNGLTIVKKRTNDF